MSTTGSPRPRTAGGGIEFRFRGVVADGSGDDDGVQIEELGEGDVLGGFVFGSASGNGDAGLEVEQGGGGDGRVLVRGSTFEGNADDGLSIAGVSLEETP